MSESVEYRYMQPGEEQAVCRLVKEVFDELVAPDFELEGIDEFYRFANAPAMAERRGPDQFVLVATRDEEWVGMIEMVRLEHIAMLFVALRGRGIATELVRRAVAVCREKNPGVSQITVHASLFAEPVYRRLGFQSTDGARTENGITYVPMALPLDAAS